MIDTGIHTRPAFFVQPKSTMKKMRMLGEDGDFTWVHRRNQQKLDFLLYLFCPNAGVRRMDRFLHPQLFLLLLK